MKFKFLLASALLISFSCIANAQTPKKKTSSTTAKSATTQVNKSKSPNAATATPPATSSPRKAATAANSRVLGQDALPEPEKHGGKPFVDMLSNIRIENTVNFSPEDLRSEQISNLLFTACGKTDPQTNSYTAFYTGENSNIDIYVINREQIMKFDKEQHMLLVIRKGNFLDKVTMQREMPMDAPLALIYTSNIQQEPVSDKDDAMPFLVEGMNCGAIMQNVFLYCVSEDLSCKAISIPETVKNELMRAINMKNGQILYGQIIGRR